MSGKAAGRKGEEENRAEYWEGEEGRDRRSTREGVRRQRRGERKRRERKTEEEEEKVGGENGGGGGEETKKGEEKEDKMEDREGSCLQQERKPHPSVEVLTQICYRQRSEQGEHTEV